MSSFVRERRGVSWKDKTLDSISPPPLPLLVFSGILIMLLYFESWSEYHERVERTKSGFRFGLFLLPLVVVLAVNMMVFGRRIVRYILGVPAPEYEAAESECGIGRSAEASDGGNLAPGLLLILLIVLVMVYYRSSVQSRWFRLF
ncbi:hypothetical protein OROHE_023511 [Orobanche hederae]